MGIPCSRLGTCSLELGAEQAVELPEAGYALVITAQAVEFSAQPRQAKSSPQYATVGEGYLPRGIDIHVEVPRVEYDPVGAPFASRRRGDEPSPSARQAAS